MLLRVKVDILSFAKSLAIKTSALWLRCQLKNCCLKIDVTNTACLVPAGARPPACPQWTWFWLSCLRCWLANIQSVDRGGHANSNWHAADDMCYHIYLGRWLCRPAAQCGTSRSCLLGSAALPYRLQNKQPNACMQQSLQHIGLDV
eukprot:6180201-Pleurochrysis_carterae.AAC.1